MANYPLRTSSTAFAPGPSQCDSIDRDPQRTERTFRREMAHAHRRGAAQLKRDVAATTAAKAAKAAADMPARIEALTAGTTVGRNCPLEVLAGGGLNHANYIRFMTGHLYSTLAPVLGDQHRYDPLLSQIHGTGRRVEQHMVRNETGESYSKLPGARDAYRRALTTGHLMTAVADSQRDIAKCAAHLAPKGRTHRRSEIELAESQLLGKVARFNNELKRAVVSSMVLHVNADYACEAARRYDERSSGGRPNPGREDVTTKGLSARVGTSIPGGSPAVKLGAGVGIGKTQQTREIDDHDRDRNLFEEEVYALGADSTVSVLGMVTARAEARAERIRGLYYEGIDGPATHKASNIGQHRRKRRLSCLRLSKSAGAAARSRSEFCLGSTTVLRKVFGGGDRRPYDNISWVTARKEEKGKYNRTLLVALAADIDREARNLARLKGVAAPDHDLGKMAAEYFPSDAVHGDRAGLVSDCKPGDITRLLGVPKEPLSVPAMPPRKGDPTQKECYTGSNIGITLSASVGFAALGQRTGSDTLRSVLLRFAGYLPSALANFMVLSHRRKLPLDRQAPMSANLAPGIVLDLAKGIEKTEAVLKALERRVPGSPSTSGACHPAFAVLRRYQLPITHLQVPAADAATRRRLDLYGPAGQSGSYLGKVIGLLECGHLRAPAVIHQLEQDIDRLANDYRRAIRWSSLAKEAKAQGDLHGYATALEAMNQTAWNGWYVIGAKPKRDKLDRFIGHTLAQYDVAWTSMQYELTIAKEHAFRHAASLDDAGRAALTALCARADRRALVMSEFVREVLPPLLPDTFHGYGFYGCNGMSSREMKTRGSSLQVSALGDTVSRACAGTSIATARGPELHVGITQSSNKVISHPNLMREGEFYTLILGVRGSAGARTVILAGEKALHKAVKKRQITGEFAKAIRDKLAEDVKGVFSANGDALAAIGRAHSLNVELSYGGAPKRGSATPASYLRYVRLLGTTIYDNGVRSPNVVALATGVPVEATVKVLDTSSSAVPLRNRNGPNVRHLLLEYAGPNGLKSILEPHPDTAKLDFEAARAALLKPEHDFVVDSWLHCATPLVDVVQKYLRHTVRFQAGKPDDLPSPAEADDEFDYIDRDDVRSRRLERYAPVAKHFASGNGIDPLGRDTAPSRRLQLEREVLEWLPRSPGRPAGKLDPITRRDERDWQADQLDKVRKTLAGMKTRAERIDYLTRHPTGQALLQQAVSILDVYASWATGLRLLIGYPGAPNAASIDLLKLRDPGCADSVKARRGAPDVADAARQLIEKSPLLTVPRRELVVPPIADANRASLSSEASLTRALRYEFCEKNYEGREKEPVVERRRPRTPDLHRKTATDKQLAEVFSDRSASKRNPVLTKVMPAPVWV
jgi:hypothetical protein